MKNKILYVAAAGSGGHILPALTLAKRWTEQNPSGRIVFWSSKKALDQKIVANAPFVSEVIGVNLTGFSLKKFWLLPVLFFWLIFAFFKCMYRSIKQRPEKIICTGGLIGLPTCVACRLTGTPVEVYELNVVTGKAVKALLPIANKIYIAFGETKKYCTFFGINFDKKCELTQYPIRFTEHDKILEDKNILITQINNQNFPPKPFSEPRKTIFILGGSQGSHSLNNAFKLFLQNNQQIHEQIQIIHQIGSFALEEWQNFYKTSSIPAIAFAYNENLKNFYQLADLIICRAGAGTIFEIEFFNKPCIVIPLVTSTTSHQVQNAYAMAKKHPELFTVVEQNALNFSNKILDHEALKKLFLSKP
jgi:UDP-N-acetylglucosamine--N-acetylmuramyl-(pentapeptide) pyrophosphoryl-undecaprenol N-acetylglucosamine transferase